MSQLDAAEMELPYDLINASSSDLGSPAYLDAVARTLDCSVFWDDLPDIPIYLTSKRYAKALILKLERLVERTGRKDIEVAWNACRTAFELRVRTVRGYTVVPQRTDFVWDSTKRSRALATLQQAVLLAVDWPDQHPAHCQFLENHPTRRKEVLEAAGKGHRQKAGSLRTASSWPRTTFMMSGGTRKIRGSS